MTSAGKLESRFFWEYLNDGYLIFDRQRGAGCFGENFIAAAIDIDAAETMCELMNTAEARAATGRRVRALLAEVGAL